MKIGSLDGVFGFSIGCCRVGRGFRVCFGGLVVELGFNERADVVFRC